MKLKHVLVVHKLLGHSRTHAAHPAPKHKRKLHHDKTIEHVLDILVEMGLTVQLIDRSMLTRKPKTDLIVCVGGDGTVIAASHVADDIPILGVNSMPGISVGFYCPIQAKSFKRWMAQIQFGKRKPVALPLLQAKVNQRKLRYPLLNDILYTSTCPAESVYYELRFNRKREFQRGSGLWICAGPGSTAGFLSAGGKPGAITSERVRFFVREPCQLAGRKFRLLKSVLPKGKELSIATRGKGAVIYCDGHNIEHKLKPGQILKVSIAKQKLKLFL